MAPRLAPAVQVRPGPGPVARGGLTASEAGLPNYSRAVREPHEEEGVTEERLLVRDTVLSLWPSSRRGCG